MQQHFLSTVVVKHSCAVALDASNSSMCRWQQHNLLRALAGRDAGAGG